MPVAAPSGYLCPWDSYVPYHQKLKYLGVRSSPVLIRWCFPTVFRKLCEDLWGVYREIRHLPAFRDFIIAQDIRGLCVSERD